MRARRRAVIRRPEWGWLAERLATRRRALEPGNLIITGRLTSARPLEAGHRVGAVFGDGRWSVEVRRPADNRGL